MNNAVTILEAMPTDTYALRLVHVLFSNYTYQAHTLEDVLNYAAFKRLTVKPEEMERTLKSLVKSGHLRLNPSKTDKWYELAL